MGVFIYVYLRLLQTESQDKTSEIAVKVLKMFGFNLLGGTPIGGIWGNILNLSI